MYCSRSSTMLCVPASSRVSWTSSAYQAETWLLCSFWTASRECAPSARMSEAWRAKIAQPASATASASARKTSAGTRRPPRRATWSPALPGPDAAV